MPAATVWRTLLVSADLEELIGLSDRLLVMLRGRVVADLDPATVTPADLGSYMTGGTNGGVLMFERIWRASLAPLGGRPPRRSSSRRSRS